jgi:hypothetical protein
MPFLHSARDTVVRDKARARQYQELRKVGGLGRDFRRNWKASIE